MELEFLWVLLMGYGPAFLYGYSIKNWTYKNKDWLIFLLATCVIVWLMIVVNSVYSPPYELRLLMSLLHVEFGLVTIIFAMGCRTIVDATTRFYRKPQSP